MISLNYLLAWNLVANTLAGREDVDPSILTEVLRYVVGLASSDERRGGVRFLPSRMRRIPPPPPAPPVDAPVDAPVVHRTGPSCAPSHSEASGHVVESAGLEESSGGARLLPSEIPSTSRPPTDASGPCADASCSSSHSEDLSDLIELAELEEYSGGVRCPPGETPSTSRPPINAFGPDAEVGRANPGEVGNLFNIGEDRLEKYRHAIRQFILQEMASVPERTLDQVKESILEGKYPALSSFLEHSGPIRRRDQDDLLPSNFDVEQETLMRLNFSTCDYGKKISQKDPTGFVQHNQHVTDGDGTDHLQMDDVGGEGNTIQLSGRNEGTLEPPDKEITNLDGGKRRLGAQTAAALFPIDCTQILQRDVSIPQSNSTLLPNWPLNEHGGNLIPTRSEKNQNPSNIIVIPDSSSDDDAEDAGYTPDYDQMFAAEKHSLLSSQANNNQDSIAGDSNEQLCCMECDEGEQLLTCNLCLKIFRESCSGSVRFNEEGLFYCCFCTHGRADLGCCKARKRVLRAKENLSTGCWKDICKMRTGQARVVENVNYRVDDLSLQHRTGGLNRRSLRAEHQKHMEVTDFPGQVEEGSVVRCNDSTNVEKVNDEQIVDKATVTVEGAGTASMNEQVEDLQSRERHKPVGNGNFPCEEGNASHSASVNEQVEDLQPTDSRTAVDNSNLPCKEGNLSHAASVNEQGKGFQPTEHHTAVDNSSLPCEEGNSFHRALDARVVQQKGEISGGDHQNIEEPDSDEQVKDAFEHDMDNEALPSRNSGRHCKRAQDASTKTVDQKRFKSSTGKRRKHAYQAKRYSNPLMPPGRRTKLLWTMEEEAALKEGMQRFVSQDSETIPWRAILEYGCGVFHKTRMPCDLKDKWRNIKIKEGQLH